MLIAISGSQGSGKSTILKRLENHGFNIITRKTSRSILTDWGVSLQEVNNNSELTLKFQEEISNRKYEDEFEAAHSSELWFTERTHMDLLTYALVSLGKDNEHSDWLTQYAHQCVTRNQYYKMIFYLQAGHFAPENDGVRGTNHLYSRMVDLVMYDLTEQNTLPDKFICVKSPLLEQRVNQIITLSKTKIYYK